MNNVASCLESLGRSSEALPQHEAALAMRRRLYGDRDHADVAVSLNNVAFCLASLGRPGEALPRYEAALAMTRRVFGERDHSQVARIMNNIGLCLDALGRPSDALPPHEAALAMWKRVYRDRDHSDVARALNNVGSCLQALGRTGDALASFEVALAMRKRLHDDRDHADVAQSLNNVGYCHYSLRHAAEALWRYEAALAMQERLYGDRDHPELARSLNNIAFCLTLASRPAEALPRYQEALSMWRRVYGERDHAHVVTTLAGVALSLESVGRPGEAVPHAAQACEMIERLRADSGTSEDVKRSFFDELKRVKAFELLQALTLRRDVAAAVSAAERSRGRDLLDLLEQQRLDPLDEAARRARLRGDKSGAERLLTLRDDLAAATHEDDRLLHELAKLDGTAVVTPEVQTQRATLLSTAEEVAARRRRLLDERGRLLADALPIGRVRSAVEIQAALQPGELFVEFTVTQDFAALYVLTPDALEGVELPGAHAAVERMLPALLEGSSRAQLARGIGTARSAGTAEVRSRELFLSLFPAAVWDRIRGSKRVFVAAHRALHRLPFELLVTDVKDGKPVYWLDAGPPISYVPSGSALHWLRERVAEDRSDLPLDVLAVGDPRLGDDAPPLPEQGVLVLQVDAGGEGFRAGLQPLDVLVRYDGQPLADDAALRELRGLVEAAVKVGKRAAAPIAIEVWRRGETLQVEVMPGLLGIRVGAGAPRGAYEATLDMTADAARFVRKGDLARLAQLPQLKGARAEAEAVAAAFRGKEGNAELLLGEQATESAVLDLAARARHVHFACHGIAEEYAGQSLSMLVLAQRQDVRPEDDGLLKLGDLLHRWRGRLSSCRLVTLAACRTNVGPTFRDDAPQALPIGFLFAGVPSVISSLWAVDDASTRELMADFYSRLVGGETDKLAAFTKAKKALRQKYADPFYWAPFLHIGSPE
jgi:tetratricopeptide (TPR) repeat protein